MGQAVLLYGQFALSKVGECFFSSRKRAGVPNLMELRLGKIIMLPAYKLSPKY